VLGEGGKNLTRKTRPEKTDRWHRGERRVGGRGGAGRGEAGLVAAAREEDGRAIAARGEGRRRGERQHRGGWW
jgi:hypothetical protein